MFLTFFAKPNENKGSFQEIGMQGLNFVSLGIIFHNFLLGFVFHVIGFYFLQPVFLQNSNQINGKIKEIRNILEKKHLKEAIDNFQQGVNDNSKKMQVLLENSQDSINFIIKYESNVQVKQLEEKIKKLKKNGFNYSAPDIKDQIAKNKAIIDDIIAIGNTIDPNPQALNTNFTIQEIKDLEVMLSPQVTQILFLTPVLSSILKYILPSQISNLIENKGISSRDIDINSADSIVKLINQLEIETNSKSYTRNFFIVKEYNFFFASTMLKGITNIAEIQKSEIKRILLDNFLGDVLNQYKLIAVPINLLRYFGKKRNLKKMEYIVKEYKKIYLKRKKYPHLVFIGENTQALFLIYALTSTFKFMKINNINFDANQKQDIFRKSATYAQETNLYSRLNFGLKKAMNYPETMTRFLLVSVKILGWLLSGTQNTEVSLNLLNVESNRSRTNIEKIKTNHQMNALEHNNKEDIVFGWVKSINDIDAALFDRFEMSFFMKTMEFKEFFYMFRDSFIRFCTQYGDCLPISELDMNQVIYLAARSVYNKLAHLSINDQVHILNNFFNFLLRNKGKITLNEFIDSIK